MFRQPAGHQSRWNQVVSRIARRRVVRASFMAGILVLALATNAFADIPDHAQVFHACILSGNLPIPGMGTMRVIDTEKGQSCTRNETPVSWDATGATGPTGAVGPQGPAGADGATGPQGPTGPAGADGAVGAQGPAGADGAVGPVGPVGPAGADGAVGPVGPVGPQGPAGADGAVGPVGPVGPAGVDGAVGAQGPQGPAGADGAVGPQGPAGNGIAAFGYFYNTTAEALLLIPTPVTLDSSGPTSNISNIPGTAAIIFNSAGIYKVTYLFNGTVTLGSQIGLTLNGIPVFGSTYSMPPVVGGSELTGQAYITVAAGDVLNLTGAGVTLAQQLPGQVNASITIEQIGTPLP
jgi:hypothetical protein